VEGIYEENDLPLHLYIGFPRLAWKSYFPKTLLGDGIPGAWPVMRLTESGVRRRLSGLGTTSLSPVSETLRRQAPAGMKEMFDAGVLLIRH
jgi:hypothetical protein